jgi:hypothetical protein
MTVSEADILKLLLFLDTYRKASGKPPTLGVGMNTVVALATREEVSQGKVLFAIFHDKLKSC